MAAMRKDEVIALIEQAFADSAYPGDDHLINANHCPECAEIAEAFQGKHWSTAINARFLREHYAALSLFQPKGFQFYLPAFILVTLKSRAPLFEVSDSLEFHLTPPETEGSQAEDWFKKFGESQIDYWLRKVSGFTTEQKQAIKAYLEARYKRNPMLWDESTQLERQRALAFWDTFEG